MRTMSEALAQEHRREMERAADVRRLRRQVRRHERRRVERRGVDIDLTAPDLTGTGKSLQPRVV